MIFAQQAPTISTNNWEFYGLVAMMAYQLIRQWLDQKTAAIGLDNAKVAAEHARVAAQNAGIAAQNASLAATQAASKTEAISLKQDEQHAATNSRLSELLETAKIAAHASGMLAGIKVEQDRTAAAAAAAAAAAEPNTGT